MTRESNAYSTLGYFNLAKGFGMVLILLGHSITPFYPRPELSEGLFSGAGSVLGGGIMAMFFMISGFGFYSRSPKRCLRIQTKTLLLPYCITTAAILITKYLLSLIKNRPFGQNGAELALTYLLGLNAEGGHTLGGIAIESVSIFAKIFHSSCCILIRSFLMTVVRKTILEYGCSHTIVAKPFRIGS